MDNSLQIKEILTNLGYNLTDYGQQWSALPLYRASDNKTALTINKNTGEFFDFVEGRGGTLEALIERTIGKPITQEVKDSLLLGNIRQNVYQDVELDHIKIFDKSLLLKLEKDYSYWIKRGISKDLIEKFQGGIAHNGRMKNRYVFPVFSERNELIGFSGRDLGNSEIKWKHLGSKTQWIYPLTNLKPIVTSKSVIIVESHGDLLKLMESDINNVLVSFGVNISSKIIETLIKININKIYIGFNNDSGKNLAGNIAAVKAKRKLLNYFDFNQVQIALPDKKDFGEQTVEENKIWFKNLNYGNGN